MAQSSAPWPPPIGDATKGTPLTGAVARAMWGAGLGDGVIDDLTGSGLAVALQSSGTIAALAPGTAVVRGTHRFVSGAEVRFDIAAVAGTGNSRIDWLVLHFDPTQTTPTTMIRAAVISGAASANPSPPAPTRSADGAWMVPIAAWTRAAGAGATSLVDLRSWVGPHLVVASSAGLPSDAPLGSTATDLSGARWWRQLVSGSPQWVTDSALAACYLGELYTFPGDDDPFTARVALTTARLAGGMTRPDSYRVAVPFTGSYRLDAQASIQVPTGKGGGWAQSMIRLNSGGSPTGGTLLARSSDWIPAGPGRVSLSLFRGSVPITAGGYLEWYLTAPGGCKVDGGAADTSITISAQG